MPFHFETQLIAREGRAVERVSSHKSSTRGPITRENCHRTSRSDRRFAHLSTRRITNLLPFAVALITHQYYVNIYFAIDRPSHVVIHGLYVRSPRWAEWGWAKVGVPPRLTSNTGARMGGRTRAQWRERTTSPPFSRSRFGGRAPATPQPCDDSRAQTSRSAKNSSKKTKIFYLIACKWHAWWSTLHREDGQWKHLIDKTSNCSLLYQTNSKI